jgi:hypothetical protein
LEQDPIKILSRYVCEGMTVLELAERGHVRDAAFAAELAASAATVAERPAIKRSQAALLFKK